MAAPSDASDKLRDLLRTLLYGVAAGGCAAAFLLLTNALYRLTFVRLAAKGWWVFLPWSLLVVVVSSLAVGFMLSKLCREAAGSGIPQLKAAYWNDLGYIPWRAAWVKFVAGIVSIGGGASLGREGPSVFMSAASVSLLSGRMGVPKQGRRHPAATGAAAGLAAAFNTPLAAITFVLEEVIGGFGSRFLGSVVLASVAGAFVAFALIGKQPAFTLPNIPGVRWHIYLLVPLVAVLASLAGILFQKRTLSLRRGVRSRSRIPRWAQPLMGGLIVWALGSVVFMATGKLGVFSLGYDDLSDALVNGLAWKTAALLLCAKLLATIASYGWGGCGGIFSPTLFLGGMAGFAVAGLAGLWMPVSRGEEILLACVGMSSCFGAVVRAPFTGLLMIFEMTHQFELVPALMIGTVIAQAIARRAGHENFYEAILQQDGYELSRISAPRDLESWQTRPVRVIMNPKPVVAADLSAAALRTLLQEHPFRLFPVETGGRYSGVVSRQAAEEAVRAGAAPPVLAAASCAQDTPIRDVAQRMVQAPVTMAVIVDEETGSVKGLLTLHDLVRAQISLAE